MSTNPTHTDRAHLSSNVDAGTTRTLREFVRRGQAAQAAVDQVLGQWIHRRCGGELVRLRGVARPVCTACGKAVL